jgi:hypothetical protein
MIEESRKYGEYALLGHDDSKGALYRYTHCSSREVS